MRRALRVVVPIGLAALTAAAAFAGLIRLPNVDLAGLLTSSPPTLPTAVAPTGAAKQAAISEPSTSRERAALPAAPPASNPKIEVARLDPDGASVIAGRAPGGSKVTLHANGQAIAEVTASDDGQWSAIVTKGIAPGTVELAVTAGAQETSSAKSPVLAVVVPPGTGRVELATAPATARPILPQRAPTSDARALGELAAMVAKARAVKGVDGAAEVAPVPITFVTGEATLTPQGQLAASLLVEYLRIAAPKGITLSGHADERGTDEFNVELSRQRLATVERHLRGNGYTGRLSLMPKGKSEPFAGIDRRAVSAEAIMQADRRVELRARE